MTYQELIKEFGNCAQAARALGLNRQTVHKWGKAGIPFEQQFRVQMKTKGRLRATLPPLK